MRIELQEFKPQDKSYVWSVYVAAMKHHIENIWGWDSEWQGNDFDQGISQSTTKIILVDTKRIGYLQTQQRENALFVRMLILESEHRSKGIGPKLLDMLQASTNYELLKLNCFKVNSEAFKFYQRCGFVVNHTDDKFIYLQRAANA